MKSRPENSKIAILFLASRPKFLTASAAGVLVGSALGFAVTGSFNPLLFVLALAAIMALHLGANMANDYFDHISGNDQANQNPTPFSGGSRYIQKGILSPKEVLLAAVVSLTAGSAIGIVIILLTQSIFILALGLIGLLGGFFYTAPPVKLGYRSVGEPIIGILFGLLPVYGSYYLQTKTVDAFVLLPAAIVGILIFLVILINDFPDAAADAAVGKKTFVVRFGISTCIRIYRIVLAASYVIAAAMLGRRSMFFAGLLYLFTLPIAIAAMKFANKEDLTTPGLYRANKITILLHSIGGLALTAGFIIAGLCSAAM